MNAKHIAIVLAGGSGSRMNSTVPKQYMELLGKPVLYYSLKCMQDSFIDEIVLVCKEGDEEYCRKEIVEKYNIDKVKKYAVGGKERYHSVYNGLKKISETMMIQEDAGDMSLVYVYIHDGARACVDRTLLATCREAVTKYGACVPAVKVKDTIKVVDEEGFGIATPNRDTLRAVQTPQCFRMDIVYQAYEKMMKANACGQNHTIITDDACVVENYGDIRIRLCDGSYNNIKITTPEDIEAAARILSVDCYSCV